MQRCQLLESPRVGVRLQAGRTSHTLPRGMLTDMRADRRQWALQRGCPRPGGARHRQGSALVAHVEW